jgi:alkylhydroperoxidase/carboxymuconolactone decarboxylase family protein YurZ
MSDPKKTQLDEIIARHTHHYMTDMGAMPEALLQLAEYAPEAFDAYSSLRTALLKSDADGAALPLKIKHLILVVLDAIRDEPIGIINHTRAAMMAGLTRAELVEGLLLGIIVYGTPAWGKVGRKAVDFAVTYEKELAAKAAKAAKAKAAKVTDFVGPDWPYPVCQSGRRRRRLL